MNEVTRMAAEAALRNMFRATGWLDITTIRKLIEATGVTPPARELADAALLHCVSWSEMPVPLRNEMARRIVGWFLSEPFDPFAPPMVEVGSGAPTRGLFGRLIGGSRA